MPLDIYRQLGNASVENTSGDTDLHGLGKMPNNSSHKPGAFAGLIALALILLAAVSTGGTGNDEAGLIARLPAGERDTLFALQYLMNPFQQRQYLLLDSSSERRAWIDRFWLHIDPTPATKANEMRAEHWARVRLAGERYAIGRAPGWDKRGETLIRFGEPALSEKNWGNIGFFRSIPIGETWYYPAIGLTVSFQDITLNGEYTYAHEIFGPTSRQILEYGRGASANTGVDEIDYIASPDIRALIGFYNYNNPHREYVAESPSGFIERMQGRPCIYSFDLEDPLPACFDVTAFRGGPGVVRTDVNVEVSPASSGFATADGQRSGDVRIEVVA